jgi:hypothetical protein
MDPHKEFVAELEAVGEAVVRQRLSQGVYSERRKGWAEDWLSALDRARSDSAQAESNSLASRAASAAERAADAAERSSDAAVRSADAAERSNHKATTANRIAIAAVMIAIVSAGHSCMPEIVGALRGVLDSAQ